MLNTLLILVGKILALFSKITNFGNGSTWPGHIALYINPNFIKELIDKNKNLKIVLIAGTNGKTTTGKLIQTILEKNGSKVFQNESGANLLNGIASSMLLHSSILSTVDYDYAVFEVDENSLPLVLNELTPNYLIILNLFRDQLDRYGEVNTIANKWNAALRNLPSSSTLILNADDPQIAHLGLSLRHPLIFYFGLANKKLHQNSHQHAVDSTYCPNCKSKLLYSTVYFSHLGEWSCDKCSYKRPRLDTSASLFYPLSGTYNMYNTHAALLFAKLNNISNQTIEQSLKNFTPAFGRQEIIEINHKKAQLFLSKNPTSFNQSLRAIIELKAKHLLIVLNDRIPDGRDISWIWDADIEKLVEKVNSLIISGDRCYDMALRIKYSIQNSKGKNQNYNSKFKIIEDLKDAVLLTLETTPKSETLYILPTYSAMLEVRKILTGKKIL